MRSLSQPPALNRNSEEYDSSGIILIIYFFEKKNYFLTQILEYYYTYFDIFLIYLCIILFRPADMYPCEFGEIS